MQEQDVVTLRNENERLKLELEALKECNIVQSMNDMKDSYREIVKENTQLKKEVEKYKDEDSQKELKRLRRSVVLYNKVLKDVKNIARKLLAANELTEQAIYSLADEDGEINIHEFHIDGMFAVLHMANNAMQHCLDYTLKRYKKCLTNECNSCCRCTNECEIEQ